MGSLELGIGLLSIGRQWGAGEVPPPSKDQAFSLLETACDLGVRFFDTAPAYGDSEDILGAFMRAHGCRGDMVVATKFGEHWLGETKSTLVDHSFDALKRSLDQSMQRLGKIDVLQLHKTTLENLRSDAVQAALQYAASLGIAQFGASVSDSETGAAVCSDRRFQFVQLPLNASNPAMLGTVGLAGRCGLTPIVNRPLNMGHSLASGVSHEAGITEAFRYLKQAVIAGVVLTGTGKPAHLKTNVDCFAAA